MIVISIVTTGGAEYIGKYGSNDKPDEIDFTALASVVLSDPRRVVIVNIPVQGDKGIGLEKIIDLQLPFLGFSSDQMTIHLTDVLCVGPTSNLKLEKNYLQSVSPIQLVGS